MKKKKKKKGKVLHWLFKDYWDVLCQSWNNDRASVVVHSSGESGGVALILASAKSERRFMLVQSCALNLNANTARPTHLDAFTSVLNTIWSTSAFPHVKHIQYILRAVANIMISTSNAPPSNPAAAPLANAIATPTATLTGAPVCPAPGLGPRASTLSQFKGPIAGPPLARAGGQLSCQLPNATVTIDNGTLLQGRIVLPNNPGPSQSGSGRAPSASGSGRNPNNAAFSGINVH